MALAAAVVESESAMKIDDLADQYADEDAPMLKADGYDNCVVGVVLRYGTQPILCYSKKKVLKKLAKEMSREEAEEWFEFNMLGAWVGEGTPCFLDDEA